MDKGWDEEVKKSRQLLKARKTPNGRVAPKRERDDVEVKLQDLIDARTSWEGKWSALANVGLERFYKKFVEYNVCARRLGTAYLTAIRMKEVRPRAVVHIRDHLDRVIQKIWNVWIDDIRNIRFLARVHMCRIITLIKTIIHYDKPILFPAEYAQQHNFFAPPSDNLAHSSLEDIVVSGFDAVAYKWQMLIPCKELEDYVEGLHIRLSFLEETIVKTNETIPGTDDPIMDYEAFLLPPTGSFRVANKNFHDYHHSTYLAMSRTFAIYKRMHNQLKPTMVPDMPSAFAIRQQIRKQKWEESMTDEPFEEEPDDPKCMEDRVMEWLSKSLTGTNGRTVASLFKEMYYGFFERPGGFDRYLALMIEDKQVTGYDLPKNADNWENAYSKFYQSDLSAIKRNIMDKTPAEVLAASDSVPFVREAKLLYFLCAFAHTLRVHTRFDMWEVWKYLPRPVDLTEEKVAVGRVMHTFFIHSKHRQQAFFTTNEFVAAYLLLEVLEESIEDPERKRRVQMFRECVFRTGEFKRSAEREKVDGKSKIDPHLAKYIL